MTTEQITPREGAVLFLSALERHGWRVYLDTDGQMAATIGDDLPKLCQAQILAILGSLDSEIVQILRELQRQVH